MPEKPKALQKTREMTVLEQGMKTRVKQDIITLEPKELQTWPCDQSCTEFPE